MRGRTCCISAPPAPAEWRPGERLRAWPSATRAVRSFTSPSASLRRIPTVLSRRSSSPAPSPAASPTRHPTSRGSSGSGCCPTEDACTELVRAAGARVTDSWSDEDHLVLAGVAAGTPVELVWMRSTQSSDGCEYIFAARKWSRGARAGLSSTPPTSSTSTSCLTVSARTSCGKSHRGIHPAILSDARLDDALGALARRSTIRVDLDVGFRGRYDPTLEASVYYVAAESITNTVKHAQSAVPTRAAGPD